MRFYKQRVMQITFIISNFFFLVDSADAVKSKIEKLIPEDRAEVISITYCKIKYNHPISDEKTEGIRSKHKIFDSSDKEQPKKGKINLTWQELQKRANESAIPVSYDENIIEKLRNRESDRERSQFINSKDTNELIVLQ